MAAAAAAASAGNNGSPLYNDFSLSADLFATRPWTALNTLCATSATDPYSIERAAKLYRNAASQWNSLMSVCLLGSVCLSLPGEHSEWRDSVFIGCSVVCLCVCACSDVITSPEDCILSVMSPSTLFAVVITYYRQMKEEDFYFGRKFTKMHLNYPIVKKYWWRYAL